MYVHGHRLRATPARIEVGSETVTWSHFGRGPGEEYDWLELQFTRDTYMDTLTNYEETT